MNDTYVKENADLLRSFVETTFFKNWRESTIGNNALANYSSLEMAIGYACDLKCAYCYYQRYGKELYQDEKVTAENVLKNTESLMNFLYKNNMHCNLDIFSGNPFSLSYIWDFLDIIYKYQSKMPVEKRAGHVSAPSNLSFLKEGRGEVLKKFQEYQEKFKSIGIILLTSGSIDGPFMDKQNRPSKVGDEYNKEFYDKVIEFSDKLKFGLHPMIYSNNIEHWIDNFLWFTHKRNDNLYLLQVRNAEWTKEQCNQMYYLMRFLINYIYVKKLNSPKTYKEFSDLFYSRNDGHGCNYNITTSIINSVGRGLGCSIQGTFNLSMNNLNLIPCHRTSYKRMSTGKFIFNEDGTYDIEPYNIELYLAMQTVNKNNLAPCENCTISELCAGPCLGANVEATGEIFVNVPTMCRMEFAKAAGLIQGFKDIKMLDSMLETLPMKKQSQIKYLSNNFILGESDER